MDTTILHKKRCIGYTKNNNRCRAIIKNNSFFCCKNHEPLNNDILINGCFMCMEKLINSSDILYLKCNHMFHKECYNDWLKEYSTYDNPICMICRNIISKPNHKIEYKTFNRNKLSNLEIKKISDIENILLNKNNI
jgi:hypothetical protein